MELTLTDTHCLTTEDAAIRTSLGLTYTHGSCDLDAAHHMRGLEIAKRKGFPPAERITVVEWQQYV